MGNGEIGATSTTGALGLRGSKGLGMTIDSGGGRSAWCGAKGSVSMMPFVLSSPSMEGCSVRRVDASVPVRSGLRSNVNPARARREPWRPWRQSLKTSYEC